MKTSKKNNNKSVPKVLITAHLRLTVDFDIISGLLTSGHYY